MAHWIDVEQGTDEWFQARMGKLTGSKAGAVISDYQDRVLQNAVNSAAEGLAKARNRLALSPKTPAGIAKAKASVESWAAKHNAAQAKLENPELTETQKTYIAEVIAETATHTHHTVKAKSLEWGHQFEPLARDLYSFSYENVSEAGFCLLEEGSNYGCSVDGVVSNDGIIEIKCPIDYGKHIKTLIWGMDEKEHKPQCQWNLWITDRKWCDFISYVKDMPPHMQLYVQRVPRDYEYIARLEVAAGKMWERVSECSAKLGLTNDVSEK